MVKAHGRAELNVEGNPFEGNWLTLVHHVAPHQATLVPDTPQQSTSDHGFTAEDVERLTPIVADLKGRGIRVSVFVNPEATAAAALAACGADRVELYTESFAVAHGHGDATAADAYVAAADAATGAGLGVNAGHDLNLENLAAFVKAVPAVQEVSIGHALIGDALELGLAEAVRRYAAAAE